MPAAETLIGQCTRRHQGVCTFRGNFHLFLANMGKTNITHDQKEQALIPKEYHSKIDPIYHMPGRVFLWDMSQLKLDKQHHEDMFGGDDKNDPFIHHHQLHPQHLQHSNQQFRKDLGQFLHLQYPLPPMIKVKPGFQHTNTTILEHVTNKKIDICESKYNTLRAVLLQQGTLAAQWIRDYFLKLDTVYVSQKDYFVNVILKSWTHDPCIDRRRRRKRKRDKKKKDNNITLTNK